MARHAADPTPLTCVIEALHFGITRGQDPRHTIRLALTGAPDEEPPDTPVPTQALVPAMAGQP